MQRCPKCNRTYEDDSQKFCTFDGGRLMVDADAPTTLDLGATVRTDMPSDLGATVMGNAPDLGKTVAGVQHPLPPQTSEIPPSAPTGPTNQSIPAWSDASPSAPTLNQMEPATGTGPTTTSPLVPPSETSQGTAPSLTAPPGAASSSGSIAATRPETGGIGAPQPAPASSGALGAATATAATPRKSNPLLLAFGGLGALLLLLIVGGVGLWYFALRDKSAPTAKTGSGSSIDKERGSTATSTNSSSSNSATSANTSGNASQPPVEAPANSSKFTNTRERLTGSLAEHFVDFSLYYPNNWTVDPKAGTSGSSNFFRAYRMLSDETGDYLLESAAVGWYQSNGTMQLDRAIFPNRVEYFNNLFAKDYPEYQKVSEGETKFNGLDGYEFLFKSMIRETGKGDINLWGRVIFLPAGSEDARNGLVLLAVASSAAPEIRSANDMGEKGQLPVILKTFRLGSSQ